VVQQTRQTVTERCTLLFGWSILLLLSYSNLIPAVTGLPLDHIGSLVNVFNYCLCGFQISNCLIFGSSCAEVWDSLLQSSRLLPLYIAGLLIMFRYYPDMPVYVIFLISVFLTILLAVISFSTQTPYSGSGRSFVLPGNLWPSPDIAWFHQQNGQYSESWTAYYWNAPNRSQKLFVSPRQYCFLRIQAVVYLLYVVCIRKLMISYQMYSVCLLTVLLWCGCRKKHNPHDETDLITAPQFKALWEAEKENLHNSQIELFCPLRAMVNSLVF